MSGSIEKFWWDGTTYEVKADADFTENAEYETEGIATSGKTLFKSTRKVATVEGIDLIVNGVEKQTLRDDARAKKIASAGYKEEDGTVNNAKCRLQIVSRTTSESKMAVVLIPVGAWEVTPA